MIKIRHIAAIFLTAILLPLMDKLSMFCFGVSMKGAIVKDMDKFFERRANDIIEQADAKRNIVKLVFSAETEKPELNELQQTEISVKIANSIADYKYLSHEVVKSNRGEQYMHTFSMKIIVDNEQDRKKTN